MMLNLAWGIGATWMLVDGYLVNTAYTAFATDLVAAKTTNNDAWTTDYVKQTSPVSA